MQGAFVVLVAAASLGCGTSTTNGGKDFSTGDAPVMGGPDLSMVVGPGSDGPAPSGDQAMVLPTDGPGPDFAKPDLARPPGLAAAWRLYDRKILGMQGGFSMNCDDKDAQIKTMTITVVNAKNQALRKETKGVPCPPGTSNGAVLAEYPDPVGPFNIIITADGKPTAKGLWVCGATIDDQVTLNLFALGCNDPLCVAGCP